MSYECAGNWSTLFMIVALVSARGYLTLRILHFWPQINYEWNKSRDSIQKKRLRHNVRSSYITAQVYLMSTLISHKTVPSQFIQTKQLKQQQNAIIWYLSAAGCIAPVDEFASLDCLLIPVSHLNVALVKSFFWTSSSSGSAIGFNRHCGCNQTHE